MFNKAFEEVLKVEGGFVNHPQDRGGATNFGITIQVLSDFLGRQATVEDVRNLSKDTARLIYKRNYWDRLRLDHVKNQNLTLALFDQAVNRGVRAVARQVQRIVGVKDDGVIGPISLKAINEFDAKKLLVSFIKQTQLSYVAIVRNDPSQLVFLTGWINRSHNLLDMV